MQTPEALRRMGAYADRLQKATPTEPPLSLSPPDSGREYPAKQITAQGLVSQTGPGVIAPNTMLRLGCQTTLLDRRDVWPLGTASRCARAGWQRRQSTGWPIVERRWLRRALLPQRGEDGGYGSFELRVAPG